MIFRTIGVSTKMIRTTGKADRFEFWVWPRTKSKLQWFALERTSMEQE